MEPTEPALARLLGDALARTPAAGIAASGETPVMAGALLETADGIATALRDAGLATREPVHVRITNRPADLAAFLGVWRAGGVAVPILADIRPETLARLEAATSARLAIAAGSISRIADAAPPRRPLLDGAALVIFTSGTTGEPKGVVIGHDRLAAKLDVLARLMALGPADRVVAPLQLTFIFGLWVAMLTLNAGARLVLMPRFSAERLAQEIDAGATVFAGVPSMLRTMLATHQPRGPRLRMILTGGEAYTPALARAIAGHWPGAGVYDLYGLTETGSCDFCLTPEAQQAGAGSLGSPTEGVAFRIAGTDGEAGELEIASPFGMLGYLDQPELTAASFRDGYLRSGDLARVRPDGRVALVGRLKELISRGGMKVAPLEIDNLLASHPDVAAALAFPVPDARLGEAIHAMVVPRDGAAVTGMELRAWIAARAERHKVPDVIHLCAALPTGATGKADRRAAAARVAKA